MTRGLLLSVQCIFRNLNEIRAEVIHSGKRSVHALDQVVVTLKQKEKRKQVLHPLRLSEVRLAVQKKSVAAVGDVIDRRGRLDI